MARKPFNRSVTAPVAAPASRPVTSQPAARSYSGTTGGSLVDDDDDDIVTVYEDTPVGNVSAISWRAILAGVAVTLAATLLLNLLGLGIGLSTLDPAGTDGSPSVGTFSTVAAFWYVLSGIIAAFVGGYTAARLSGRYRPSTNAWHGLVTWSATMLVVVVLLASAAGHIIGGAAKAVGGAVSALGQGAAVATMAPPSPDRGPAFGPRERAQGNSIMMGAQDALQGLRLPPGPMGQIAQQLRELSGGSADPAVLRDATTGSIVALLSADPQQAEAARQQAVTSLARSANIPTAEAQARIDTVERNYQMLAAQAAEQTRQAADTAAKAASAAALMSVLALVLGALAGWLGGLSAAPGRGFTVNPVIRERDEDYV